MTNSNLGVMMTLAQLAALSPNPRPSGEPRPHQAQRILAGINNMLQNSSLNLPTGTSWHALWVGLTVDGGNLCYIAASPTQNAFAVCCRGTQFNSFVDLGEDLDVGNVCQFLPPGSTSPLVVSQGAMKAFTEATNATGVLNGTPGLKLLGALEQLVSDSKSNSAPTIYVTGHSLGGAMSTMIALYLAGQTWPQPTPLFQVYTFAAPTAGVASFAQYYDQVFTSKGNSFRTYNQWDAVPYAWADLTNVQSNFYPAPSESSPSNPGPYQGEAINIILSDLENLPNDNVYVQTNGNKPSGQNTVILESTYTPGPPGSPSVQPTLAGFMGQIAYQHNCYLQLITGEPDIWPSAGETSGPPQVTGISPNNGPIAGGVQVTITGGVFTSDCVVDFGSVPATVVTIAPGQIVAIQPPGTGTVDVRVTNAYGTSAVTLADQFTAPRPLAPTISSVTAIAWGPPSNQAYVAQILGTGFVIPSQANTVNFGSTAGSNVQVLSLSEILVIPPAQGSGPASVNVQVTNDLGTSQPSSFMLGTPVVTSVTASSGPAKNANPITISGFGFQQDCTVTFVSTSPIIKSLKNITPTSVSGTGLSLTLTPPNITILAGAYNVVYNVQVTNPDGQVSPITPADLFMYYPS